MYLLYKCPEVKSKDFKSQEKRERKFGKTVGVHAVGGGGRIGKKKERKKDGKKEIAENKNPEQLPGRDQLVIHKLPLL
jgi:hypothetical protein